MRIVAADDLHGIDFKLVFVQLLGSEIDKLLFLPLCQKGRLFLLNAAIHMLKKKRAHVWPKSVGKQNLSSTTKVGNQSKIKAHCLPKENLTC